MCDKKLVALTFDDGPTVGITDQVLDVLQENEITASFFLIGQQITDETRYLVKRAHDMGCSIENHSKTHQSMPKQSRQEIVEEIQYTSGLIEEITGERPEFFRPPFIDYDQKMFDLIDLGFISGYGCEDWLPSVTAQERVDRILHAANPGFIILLHDMADNTNTVEAIRMIIPELKKQGYEFVTIRELFQKSGIKPRKNAVYMGVNEIQS